MCRENIHLFDMSRKFGFRVPPETATVLRENDLLCYGWTVSSPESSSRPHCERRTERSACITSKFESCHPGRSDSNFDVPGEDSAAASCVAVRCLVRSRNDCTAPKPARRLLIFYSTSCANRASVVGNRAVMLSGSGFKARCPLPRQRHTASAELRWWRRNGSPRPRGGKAIACARQFTPSP